MVTCTAWVIEDGVTCRKCTLCIVNNNPLGSAVTLAELKNLSGAISKYVIHPLPSLFHVSSLGLILSRCLYFNTTVMHKAAGGEYQNRNN